MVHGLFSVLLPIYVVFALSTIAIAIVGRAKILERKLTKKKQKTDTKKDRKRIKNDNFTRSNSEKSNIAIAILEKLMIGWQHNYFVFGGSNNIFADCISIMLKLSISKYLSIFPKIHFKMQRAILRLQYFFQVC